MTEASTSDKAHEQEAMLSELESIKELLFESDDFEECDIPVLDHTVIDEDSTTTSSSTDVIDDILSEVIEEQLPVVESKVETEAEIEITAQVQDNEEHDSLGAEILESEESTAPPENSRPIDQPSLFQDPSTVLNNRQQSVKAQGENPFLPKHIRDRLQGNRAANSNITQPLPVQLEVDQILDDIINQFLPAIETKLRAHLKPVIDRQLSELDNNNEPL